MLRVVRLNRNAPLGDSPCLSICTQPILPLALGELFDTAGRAPPSSGMNTPSTKNTPSVS